MVAPALLLALLTAGGRPDATREVFKGSALFHTCQAEVRLMELPSLTTAARKDLIDGTYCVGYLNGFLANLTSVQTSICTNDASMGAVVRAYVDFMTANADLLEEDRRLGVRRALQRSFPCPVDKRSQPEISSEPQARTL